MLIEYTPVPRVLRESSTVKLAKQCAVAAEVELPLNRIRSCTVLASVLIPLYMCDERPSEMADSSSIPAKNVPISDATGRAASLICPAVVPSAVAASSVYGSGALLPSLGEILAKEEKPGPPITVVAARGA